jgi:hypothetical protein
MAKATPTDRMPQSEQNQIRRIRFFVFRVFVAELTRELISPRTGRARP